MFNITSNIAKNYNIPLLPKPSSIITISPYLKNRKLSISEFEDKFNFKWMEWNIESEEFPEFQANLFDTLAKIKIQWMGDQLGFGIFSLEKLKKGAILGAFTGEIFRLNRNKINVKDFTKAFFFLDQNDKDFFIVIDGEKQGNVSRFIQHLPAKEELDSLNLGFSINKEDIAIENLSSNVIDIGNGIITPVFSCKEDISAGQILGCSYSPEYWLKELPTLFSKNGEIYFSPDAISKKY